MNLRGTPLRALPIQSMATNTTNRTIPAVRFMSFPFVRRLYNSDTTHLNEEDRAAKGNVAGLDPRSRTGTGAFLPAVAETAPQALTLARRWRRRRIVGRGGGRGLVDQIGAEILLRLIRQPDPGLGHIEQHGLGAGLARLVR
jgi:hypothetical protein